MARDLVSGILDVQLRQLEENGLDSLELYGDIRTMREHIDELIDAEMPEVMELLSRLATDPADRQEHSFLLARQKSREILVRLLVERQALLRRLRVAEMVAQVKRLIELETAVLDSTESMGEQVQSERESLTLSTIEDQRDVKALYLGLKEMLRDASAWGGPVGAEAATGLRRLESGRVDQHVDNAREHLQETRFSDAATSLRAVIEGLRALLERIERAQGLISGDADSARDMIRQLAGRQEQVRQATSQPDLTRAAMDELAQQQSEIRNELTELQEEFQPSSAPQRPLEQAEDAAYEATADLFEGRPDDALTEQEKVLENLAQAARQVERPPVPQAANLTAEEYDQLIEDLEGAREDLEEIRNKQRVASESARAEPAEARKQESEVADMLAEVPQDRRLPPEVTSRLDEAEEAASAAAAEMNRPEQQRLEAANKAEQAIERAASEVETALADARRHRLGIEIAELAQAAKALDQAAAAERQIAHEAQQAADSEGLEADEANRLRARQDDVQDVAAKVAEGVDQTAPEAAGILNEASEPLRRAGERLQAAADEPGQTSKPAAAEAARQADQAAEKLAQAADEIRRQIGRAAEDLAALAGKQLEQATEARQAVENVVENRPESLAERLQRLAQAEEKVRRAAAEQQRAAGRPEAAEAMELAAGIQRAVELQNQADRAAQAAEDRPDASALEAIAKQQDVAQAADRLAQQAAAERRQDQAQQQDEPHQSPSEPSDEGTEADSQQQPNALTEALERAEQAAGEAARELLDARPDQAQAARMQTREALEQALELAKDAAERVAEAPAGDLDPAAQERVGEAVAEAEELAQPDAPRAAETLEEAGQTSQQARQQAAQADSDAAADSQTATAELIEQAERQLAEAIDRLARQAGEQLAEQSQQAGRLTDQAIPVDPGATADLQSAETQAAQAANEVPKLPEQAAPAEEGIDQAMDEAVADLVAREQQLARDKALAEALAQLATQQQEAADQLVAADQRQPEPEVPVSPNPLAEALAQAWQQLTQLQQATVQAAQQVAGRNRMANEPIQQAMALAASMSQPGQPSQVSSPDPTGGGAAQQGQFVQNQPHQAGQLQQADDPPEGVNGTPDSRNQDAETRQRRLIEAPWVLELPPELRAAIRASSQRRPPRGYEERLERYFRNID